MMPAYNPDKLFVWATSSDIRNSGTLWSYLHSVTIAAHEPVEFCDSYDMCIIWWALRMPKIEALGNKYS